MRRTTLLRAAFAGLKVLLLGACAAAAAACGRDDSPIQPRETVNGDSQSPPQSGAAAEGAAGLPTVALTPAFPRLSFARPVFLTHAGDGSDRIFVLEQPGRIRVFENRHDVAAAGVFLDIRDKVQMNHNEEGLLALAFHPKYRENGRLFVYYTPRSGRGEPKRNRLAEYRVTADDPNKADAASERVIIDIEQPWGNHNGSTLLFGPDGYLYMSHGDGGSANDPHNNGQNLRTLLGSITRIDIDRQENGRPYAVPSDNPFVDQQKFPGARPEIWAYGLRNVWRMSFDRATGELWAGDVGQNAWEEIDLIVKGGNYGWNIREGRHAFSGSAPPGAQLIDPVAEYSHREGLSVTGGYVYRGQRLPGLVGVYFYGDYATGRIWGLRYENGRVIASVEVLAGRDRAFIASFGEDEAGEVYVCAFDRLDGRGGRIMRLTGR